MAQRRIDRFAQMSKQEELIAKKRQEILEKARTTELAKAVAAAQTLAAKLKENNGSLLSGAGDTIDSIPSEILVAKSFEFSDDVIEEKCENKEKDSPSPSEVISPLSKTHSHSLAGKTGKMSFGMKRMQSNAPAIDQPPPKVQNSFCNDGSFLENFKKILEKQEKVPPPPPLIVSSEITTSEDIAIDEPADESQEKIENEQQQLQTQVDSMLPVQVPPPPSQYNFNTAMMLPPQPTGLTHLSGYPSVIAPPPPPPPHTLSAAFFAAGPPQLVPPPPTTSTVAAAMMMPLHVPNIAPPPPPPPQIPLTNLPPLYMLPSLAAQTPAAPPTPIPDVLHFDVASSKEYELNAIPKPQLNLDAIQIPNRDFQEQQQENQEQQKEGEDKQHDSSLPQSEVLSDHNSIQSTTTTTTTTTLLPQQQQQLPTTVEYLIEMVAVNGDEYEDRLRTHKNQLLPAMWFLFDTQSEQYRHYRDRLNEYRERQQRQQSGGTNMRAVQQQQQLQLPQPAEQKNQRSSSTSSSLSSDIDQKIVVKVNSNNNNNKNNNQNRIRQTTDALEKYDPESVIDSGDVDSDDEYMRERMDRNRDNLRRLIECRNELSEEEREERRAELLQASGEMEEDDDLDDGGTDEQQRQKRKKMRKSRWGEKVSSPSNQSAAASTSRGGSSSFGNQNKPILATITRNDPGLLQYARQNYGSVNLSEEDWKKCEEHYKVNLLYQDMLRKRQELDRLARSGKFKYEYDSDENVDGGTWEHKLRSAEMEATKVWATALTKTSEGKHHIGDFLPPEELKKFMEQYEAKKNNRQPDLSDYKEYKLKEDNIGFQMLQKLGWKEGQGLGQDGAGIVDPVNKGPKRDGNQGLGVNNVVPEECDNEYDAYRKRMMLAYRFRPNPLNNPRRAYY